MIHCYRCNATYSPGNWYAVRDRNGRNSTATPDYVATSKIPDEFCPICCKPPLLEKPMEVTAF